LYVCLAGRGCDPSDAHGAAGRQGRRPRLRWQSPTGLTLVSPCPWGPLFLLQSSCLCSSTAACGPMLLSPLTASLDRMPRSGKDRTGPAHVWVTGMPLRAEPGNHLHSDPRLMRLAVTGRVLPGALCRRPWRPDCCPAEEGWVPGPRGALPHRSDPELAGVRAACGPEPRPSW